MKNKLLKLLAVIFCGATLAFGVSACGGKADGGASSNTNSSTVEQSSNSGTGNNAMAGKGITFKTLIVDGTKVTSETSLSNATTEFSFADEIEVKNNATYEVSSDKYGSQTYVTKVVPLEEGDNTFYVFEIVEGNKITYKVTLRRRPMYTVSFATDGGSAVESQTVEEGFLATEPETIKIGYTCKWSYDFTKPIMKNITVGAEWEMKSEMSNFRFTSTATACEITGLIDKKVTSVVIPDYVTSIGNDTFDKCYSLTSVVIGDGVTSIRGDTFRGCDSLTSVVIGDGVTSIGDYAFRYCDSLTSIIIPDGVTSIGDYAFHVCSGLTSVVIGGGVASIGDYAFYDCDSLTSVTIPDSVTSIGDYAFSNCISLTSATVGGGLTSINYRAFFNCYSLTSVVIGDGVQSIGEAAFQHCYSLMRAQIPNSVTSIGEAAFRYCYSLTIYCEAESEPNGWSGTWNYANRPVVWDCNNNDVASDGYIYVVIDNIQYGIQDGVATVARQARNIQTANIPTGITYKNNTYSVTSIGPYAFDECSSLLSVSIGDGVQSIGDYAFRVCRGLTSVVIGGGVASIGDHAFYYCDSLTSITIPDNVTSIGDDAFCVCSGLTSVVIGGGVTSIGSSAFYNCDSLTSITIPDNVTSIGEGAFSNCSSLTSITIPDNVTSIGGGAFYNCSSLTEITLPFVGATKDGTSNTNFGYIFGERDPKSLKKVKITLATSIRNNAFEGCSSLTSITMPDSVTSIGNYAFADCSSLTSINIPDSVTSIGNYAFRYCDSLTSVVIGDGVTSIGIGAFYCCSRLTSITVSENNTAYKSVDGNLYSKDGTTLIQYAIGKTATSFTIPDSVTSIGNGAFYCCTSLTSVEIGDSVTSIGNYAFADCSSLTIYCEVASRPSGWKTHWNDSNCPVYWYSETQPTTDGNYWHYVDGVPTVWE